MNVKCTHCGAEYIADSADLGKSVVCESCHNEFVIGQGNIRSTNGYRFGANGNNKAVGVTQWQPSPQIVVVKKSWLEQVWYLMVLLVKVIVLLMFLNRLDGISSSLFHIRMSVDNLENRLEKSSEQIYHLMSQMRVY